MSQQIGWRGFLRRVQQEAPYWSTAFPQMPRLIHQALTQQATSRLPAEAALTLKERRRQNVLLVIIAALLAAILIVLLFPTYFS